MNTVSVDHRCRQCGAFDTDTIPLVKDLLDGDTGNGGDLLICANCWLNNVYQNEDVLFVLETIEQFIPESDRKARTFHHTISEWADAVLSVRKMGDMKRFLRGYTMWRVGPEKSREEAEIEARENIGAPLCDASWWIRFKWWWACRIVVSENFHM